jgi:hypothetical protein
MFCFYGFLGCENPVYDEFYNSEVESYISLLKAGDYDLPDLPDFTYKDIPALLKYRNEDCIITNFPHNPVSSLYAPECKLGIYVLWTIESIRSVAIDGQSMIMRFPSQNPVLIKKESDGIDIVTDPISHAVVANAYFLWWEFNRGKKFDSFKRINPLEKTPYRWH